MRQELDSGAEAAIFLDNEIITKSRLVKGYRLKEIDDKLRKFRTRREAKVLQKLQDMNFPAPKMIKMSDKDMDIDMEFIKGSKVRDILHDNPLELSREIGSKLGLLHTNGIIHGDLTTSNMILSEVSDSLQSSELHEIKFIDFGLSFFSNKIEDKAVDLHLLRQALESKHHIIWQKCFQEALDGYAQSCPDHLDVLKRLEQVESRGRHKNKH